MPHHRSLLLPTPAQCGEMDRLAYKAVPIATLMDRAGWAVARAIRLHFTPCRVLVLCGPGNNGGDGYVAARYLAQMGWPVAVAALAEPRSDSDAAKAAALFKGPRVPFSAKEAARTDLVVDAIFGAGLSRAPEENVVSVLKAAQRVVAIDMPTGIDGATGAILGDAPDCELTVTFVRPKPGHKLLPGSAKLGDFVCADIGEPQDILDQLGIQTWHNEPGLWRIPPMTPESYKYSRGVVSICAGGSMPGAARLSAAGARASGAGLVRISAGENAPAFRLGAPGLIVDDGELAHLLQDERRKVWICGPGLTPDEVAETLPILLKAERIVLADAGALTWGAENPERLKGVAAITPHIGEFSRLFGKPGEDRLSAAREAARKINAVVVMKGADTIIVAPDGRAAINDHASPALATAGSGDTLAGVIGTMLAAGMPVWEACCAGVWLHGEAGLRAGDWPIAEDLDAHLGAARTKAIELGL
ncbi:bifunctional ADP-dependent NAD(P)H-hydrate dehydratase/NAD(P)H-hydrate epimerase [Kozakia baliensis]|uniref:bifunctional ADP-dependent NAD(P)H-hydrate dehydratase/NAD(P)H-hydrate epimerase n=1 Tax=Kozakia baliensis TaxID=153496 RepID=UPI000496442F|nr:bifunctional ADP-dependent NAD(P)H-hydrate dehydratase/NAD(P)H-hydrate epimerase [Kozakia baliensis]